MQTTDVLVASAGPVGLMMACELRRHGVGCRVIDPLPEAARQCKAIGIQPRTLEIGGCGDRHGRDQRRSAAAREASGSTRA
jgi:2-polyprenyl-6-methoxyphenol hydroxylase-like FAD-dependent oxidoreductase